MTRSRCHPVLELACALLLACASLAAQPIAPLADAPGVEPIRAVRLGPGERLPLDGTLQHPAWRRAPVHWRFFTMQPLFDQPLPQQTAVQVLFDGHALYVGVTAYDTRTEQIRDPVVRADQVSRTQDFVVVYIDAIGTKRSAQWFRVNAGGSMADGLHTAADDSEDFSPDFDWDATVARNGDGWTAVFRLPLAALRYAHGAHEWRIMVARRLPREQFHLLTSVPIPREAPSFIHHLQPLVGISLPEDSQFLTLRPSLTLRLDRAPDGARRREPSAGLDLKWRPRAEAVIDATLNPDFSQVALDVPQLAGNSRFALSYPEKRPFFFESADLLRTPTDAFYTRSYTAPRWGLRGTWRSPVWAGTALALDDRGEGLVLLPGAYATGAAAQPASRVLAARARSDGGLWQWGGLVAARQYASDRGDNTVVGPDLEWQMSPGWRLRGQWLHSRTTALDGAAGLTRGPAVAGDRVFVRAFHQGDHTEAQIGIDDTGAGFRHDSGFVNQVGVRRWHGLVGRGWQRVGPFNEFWLNIEWGRVLDHRNGQVVSEHLRPGLWSTAARNLEWWAEWYTHSVLRTAYDAPLLRENYLETGLVMTPARWFPLVDAKLTLGQIADTMANEVRPGGSVKLTASLRPLSRLELEPSVSTAWLRRGGQQTYGETALQGLGVWHFDARHTLRLIAERRELSRDGESFADGRAAVAAERSATITTSLTYSWRESAGTRLYIGASRAQQREPRTPAGTEVFVKLQMDAEDARGWMRPR